MSTFIDPVTKHKLKYAKKGDIFIVFDDNNMPHWAVDAEDGECYGYGEICQQV